MKKLMSPRRFMEQMDLQEDELPEFLVSKRAQELDAHLRRYIKRKICSWCENKVKMRQFSPEEKINYYRYGLCKACIDTSLDEARKGSNETIH
jgi:superfamily II helicase|tara:strand:- start:27 stop:305 length:279 start_codon:yes stop_codon:yes gene_type:complete